MKKTILFGGTGLIVAIGMLAFGYVAGETRTAQANDAPVVVAQASDAKLDRAQVETIVREYLLDNPEMLLEMQGALEARQKEEQRVAGLEAITQNKDAIFNAATDGVVGNPDGDVTIVEFFDYNCGYCKRALEDKRAMVAADPNLRFVLKEFPILGPDSQKAHLVSMAFHKLMPEKFAEFHDQLLGGQGRAGEDSAMAIAVSLGADENAMREAMKDPSIMETFAKTYELANQLQITGTPSYVVGNEVVFGALGQEVLSEKVAAARACLDTGC
ncbi:DsbA family protein [Mesorhizobium sp. SB112]|uniref:DsbA family protein n=1 Tax=Mesorhizobium sp. SB112 TaxID=3151853 RepID=UPI0032656AEF